MGHAGWCGLVGKSEERDNDGVRVTFLHLAFLGGIASAAAGYLGALMLHFLPHSVRTEELTWAILLMVGLIGASYFVSWLLSPPRFSGKRTVFWCIVTACLAGMPYTLAIIIFGELPSDFVFGFGPFAVLGGAAYIIYTVTDEIYPWQPEKQVENRELAEILLDPFVPLTYFTRLIGFFFVIVASIIAVNVTTIVETLWPEMIFSLDKIGAFLVATLISAGMLGYSIWRLHIRACSAQKPKKK